MRFVVALALAACTGPRFLGERLPTECRSPEHSSAAYMHCEAALKLRGWYDGYLTPTNLDAYVAHIEDRIARASTLDYIPEVVVAPAGAAVVVGRSIVIGRSTIVSLGTEAEVAAILAHETAHLEARIDDTGYIGVPVDEESIADERGVVLLGRAGYPTHAMASALGRVLTVGEYDPYHPDADFRVRRTTLAASDDRTDDTRDAHLDHLAGTIVGRDAERGVRSGDAWIFADRDLVVHLPPGMVFDNDRDQASASKDRLQYGAWRLGSRIARDLASRLAVHAVLQLPIGRITIGVAPPKPDRVTSSLERLIAERTSALADVYNGELAAVIENAHGSMVVSITGRGVDDAMLRRWLSLIRPLTAAERAATISPRLVFVRAAKTGTVRELVAACIDPEAARELDDPDRVVAAGERVKCTDRKQDAGAQAYRRAVER